ncbi:8542_t:CDS:2 [Paraglomus brasilianum]|uniref:8542_t:CDS:1 n=1 Tax=Paraglomus brasilianum TaxID=144538 RepID=A0A9N9BK48_9GLOM|nr:8542_t:CDS:2 [Paraglomus brasilianum]
MSVNRPLDLNVELTIFCNVKNNLVKCCLEEWMVWELHMSGKKYETRSMRSTTCRSSYHIDYVEFLRYLLPPQNLSTMFLTRSEYDRGVNTFSPEGRLFQVEYAIEAIKLGSTAVGIQTSEGVVLAAEKRVTSPLLVSSSIEKIMEIDKHLGCAMSGLTADSRTMIDHARVAAQSHRFTYDEAIKVESVTQAVCDLALRFGESAEGEESIMSRPFGVALLIAGVDENGPQLFHADPSGTFTQFDAKAIGSGSEGAQTELEGEYHKSITLEKAETLSLRVLKQVMEEKLNNTNVELASVTPDRGYRIYSEDELQSVIDRL